MRSYSQSLGDGPHTPLDEALEATLVGLGCFSAPASSEGSSACLGAAQWTEHEKTRQFVGGLDPRQVPTTEAATINADLLAFIQF